MRFLCLHGNGANSKIFEMQTVAIRHGLGDEYSYEYMDGAIQTSLAPEIDMITNKPGDEPLQYFDQNSPASFEKALDGLEAFVEQEGPFDGVMAFSAGATLASALMARKITNSPAEERLCPTFKCAVFFSAGPPTSGPTTESAYAEENRELIQIPTAHIWGENDQLYPTAGKWLYPFCRTDKSSVFVHPGGHDLPGLKDRQATLQIVRAIKRTVARAIDG